MRKKLRKLLLMLLFASFGCIHGYAQDDKVLGIIIELTSGAKIEYQLSRQPKLSFDGQTITLTATGATVEYTATDLAKVTTGLVDKDITEGIAEVSLRQGEIKATLGLLRFSGFAANEPIRAYSISGALKVTYYTDANGTLILPMIDLPQGINIIKTNNQSIKITKQ